MFKVGDRVVYVKDKDTVSTPFKGSIGIVKDFSKTFVEIEWEDLSYLKNFYNVSCVVHKDTYDSPLYKLMQED